jgi:hypothetical protein
MFTRLGRFYTVKKVIVFPVPGRDVTFQTLNGVWSLSLISDNRLGTGKPLFFYGVPSCRTNYTVIRFVSITANFDVCTIVGLNGTLVEAKICTFKYLKCVF